MNTVNIRKSGKTKDNIGNHGSGYSSYLCQIIKERY